MTAPNQFCTPQAHRYTLHRPRGCGQTFTNYILLPPRLRALNWLYSGSADHADVARLLLNEVGENRTLRVYSPR